ncbi:helix-turn-helix domain-containing protein [Varunaivibrio sulfuroxidans]|uniref:Transcriptional regulator with XRE-family HTH domain n=1 Tax=Varunaivibrio sulfuroxidans TaxID=1773489 RepID=A0A4R3JJ54_9PROT|nr:helix-turn-helix transcriptional regulator [Varunaivibrio sulfuroxidans]TCS64880.1 transcriptional regulator with XRE-family HTH domain [Varunaivibrio sulfuroxidans]WES29823.1 helix-turn-helix transcriptional regulator [Varunaivibrio sulfuroxidans]
MTPFGVKMRALREQKGLKLKDMAQTLRVSSAYLSALEHGHRGRPGPGLVMQVCELFGLIWDDAEEIKRLARLSHPKVTLDTSGLSPRATELANLLGEAIDDLDEATLQWMIDEIKSTRGGRPKEPLF